MNKPISKNMHGLIDYSYALLVPAIPEVVKFKMHPRATVLCRILGAGALTYSLLTKAKWGLIRVLPFKTHLAVDLTVSCVAIAAPWLMGFSKYKGSRNALIAIGAAGLAASVLTNPEE